MKNCFKLLLLLAPVLTSCNNVLEKYTNQSIINYDAKYNRETINIIDTDRLIRLIDYSSVNVFMYSSRCTPCEEATANINKYIKEENDLIYFYDVTSSGYTSLVSKYSFLQNDFEYPSLLMINQGELVYEIPSNKLNHYEEFKKLANTHLSNNKIYTFQTEESYYSYFTYFSESLVYLYNSNFDRHVTYMQKQIIEPNEKINKNILLLDINLINDNVLKALWDFFETESIYYFVAYYNLEEKRFVDVNIHYESSIALLDLFFERS